MTFTEAWTDRGTLPFASYSSHLLFGRFPSYRHSDLLSFIAQKESRSLELREELTKTDAELASLKKKWEGIVRRAQAGLSSNPSASSSNAPSSSGRPSHALSNSTSSDRSSIAGGGREGSHRAKESVSSTDSLLSRETIDSGKRFLNHVPSSLTLIPRPLVLWIFLHPSSSFEQQRVLWRPIEPRHFLECR
jgi:hypothetical protein